MTEEVKKKTKAKWVSGGKRGGWRRRKKKAGRKCFFFLVNEEGSGERDPKDIITNLIIFSGPMLFYLLSHLVRNGGPFFSVVNRMSGPNATL